MVPDATYWLGETYYRRGRYPDAVEQYLKIYKTYRQFARWRPRAC